MRFLIGMLVCFGLGCAGAPPKPTQVESTQADSSAKVEDDKTETSTDQGAGEVDLDSVKEEEIDLGLEGGPSSGPISVESINSDGEEVETEETEESEEGAVEAATAEKPKKDAKAKPKSQETEEEETVVIE